MLLHWILVCVSLWGYQHYETARAGSMERDFRTGSVVTSICPGSTVTQQGLLHTTPKKLKCFWHVSPSLPQVYRSEFIAQWRELQLDVVLCPVLGPAFTIGFPGKLLCK